MRSLATALCVLLLAATPAAAQILNGDFSGGSTGWVQDEPMNWTIEFQDSDGNPDHWCRMMSPFGNSQGEACIMQVFQCNSPGGCDISVDVRHEWIDSSPLMGRVRIFLDGGEAYVSPAVNVMEWTTVPLTPVDEGIHTIALCLQVDEGNNGWEAGFDNVLCPGCQGVAIETLGWGTVKARY